MQYTDYGAAILLIRNPFDAVVSYNKWLKSGSHTKDMQNPLGKNPLYMYPLYMY